jgi:hypothetical protein
MPNEPKVYGVAMGPDLNGHAVSDGKRCSAEKEKWILRSDILARR